MKDLPKINQQALSYYVGVPDAYPDLSYDNQAYSTINSLFFPGIHSETTRIKEGKRLNVDIVRKPREVLKICKHIIDAMKICEETNSARVVYRVDRDVDFQEMFKRKHTIAFTSTSTLGFLDTYANKENLVLLEFILPKNTPYIDMSEVLPSYSKPEEAEILLPPWLQLYFVQRPLKENERSIKDIHGNPPVSAWIVTAGFPIENNYGSATGNYLQSNAIYAEKVINALINNKSIEQEDQWRYEMWKEAFLDQYLNDTKGVL